MIPESSTVFTRKSSELPETFPGNLAMLTIHCAACKKKLWRYDKIGPGEVLRCHKARITRMYPTQMSGYKIQCPCGKDIGIDKGTHYKMIAKAFTYKGTKRN